VKSSTDKGEIASPVAEVQTALEDIAHHEPFFDHVMTDWRRITRQRTGVGTAVKVKTRHGRHPKLVMRVIKSSPRKVVHESKGGKEYRRRLRNTYELRERRNGATRVRCTVEFLEGSIGDRIAWPVRRRKLARVTQKGLHRMKSHLES